MLEGDDSVKVWQSDMSNAFYFFRLPAPWQRFLSFNVLRDGKDIGLSPGKSYALSCTVLPMGWLSSVSIMQEISENLLLSHSISRESQLSRSQPLPLWMVGLLKEARHSGRSWWHVYLDNFAAGQILGDTEELVGGELLHQLAEEAWASANVISAEKKEKEGSQSSRKAGGFHFWRDQHHRTFKFKTGESDPGHPLVTRPTSFVEETFTSSSCEVDPYFTVQAPWDESL